MPGWGKKAVTGVTFWQVFVCGALRAVCASVRGWRLLARQGRRGRALGVFGGLCGLAVFRQSCWRQIRSR